MVKANVAGLIISIIGAVASTVGMCMSLYKIKERRNLL